MLPLRRSAFGGQRSSPCKSTRLQVQRKPRNEGKRYITRLNYFPRPDGKAEYHNRVGVCQPVPPPSYCEHHTSNRTNIDATSLQSPLSNTHILGRRTRSSKCCGCNIQPLTQTLSQPVESLALTISSAKKMPAMGALKPAATPAAAPAPNNIRCRSTERWDFEETKREDATPSSTAGPSGPRELPVPRVATAASVLPKVLFAGIWITNTQEIKLSTLPRFLCAATLIVMLCKALTASALPMEIFDSGIVSGGGSALYVLTSLHPRGSACQPLP